MFSFCVSQEHSDHDYDVGKEYLCKLCDTGFYEYSEFGILFEINYLKYNITKNDILFYYYNYLHCKHIYIGLLPYEQFIRRISINSKSKSSYFKYHLDIGTLHLSKTEVLKIYRNIIVL
jgi:hypothetical protein